MSNPGTTPVEELIFTEDEFDALLTAAEWPTELGSHPEYGPALAAISEPHVMGGAEVIAVGQRRTHMFWVRGIDVAFLIDLGVEADGVRRVQLTRLGLDALPLLLAEATGTVGTTAGGPARLSVFTEQDFQELFLAEEVAPDALLRRDWERAWRITAMPGHNPDESFEAAGVLLQGSGGEAGYMVRGAEARGAEGAGQEAVGGELPLVPAGGGLTYLEFCQLAALIDTVTE